MSLDPSFTFNFNTEGVPVPHKEEAFQSVSSKKLPILPNTKVFRKKKRRPRRKSQQKSVISNRPSSVVSDETRVTSSRIGRTRGSIIKASRSAKLLFKNPIKSARKVDRKKGGSSQNIDVNDVSSNITVGFSRKDTQGQSLIDFVLDEGFLSSESKNRDFTHENSEFGFKHVPVTRATTLEVLDKEPSPKGSSEEENHHQLESSNKDASKEKDGKTAEEETDLEILIAFYKKERPDRLGQEARAEKLISQYEVGYIAVALYRKYKKYPLQWEDAFRKAKAELMLNI